MFCNCIIWFSLNDVYQTHLEEDESDLLKQSILKFCADLVSRVPVFFKHRKVYITLIIKKKDIKYGIVFQYNGVANDIV